ncbi:3-isopropylmalate dehydratase small subunit [Salipiger sp.]|uniref:3-isopropylmalate dehydratase small subunit n=1 Tax=Salipiger sp. TaxID=2078585 RepID=UPI003A969B8E
MEPFVRVSGPAAALPAANVDTDVIMPKQFLKRIDRAGLGQGLFHGLRFDDAGRARPEFVLNRAETRQAKVLITGSNFGCGSSREHAVWGLMQYGIRVLIGTSFAGIFFDNCARNGLLALVLPETQVAALSEAVLARPGLEVAVDLGAQTIAADGAVIGFDIPAAQKEPLFRGLDAIDLTLEHRNEIRAFQDRHYSDNPWLW